jgi:hypothetical protein
MASSEYWDAAAEDQRGQSPEEQERERRDAMRDRLRAGLTRLQEDLAAGGPPVHSSER